MMGELERSETLFARVSERASNFEPSELYETKLREGAQAANGGQRFQRVAAGRPTARRPGIWFLADTRFSAALAETKSPGLASPSGCTTERRGGEHQD
jgi:ABC-type sugar transport system ATPase subunit